MLALHAGRYYKTSSGLDLGPGCFVKGLEYCANCKAEIIGKPSKDFFKLALGKTFPDDTVMIGDVSFSVIACRIKLCRFFDTFTR